MYTHIKSGYVIFTSMPKAIGNARHPLYLYDQQQRKATSAPNQHLLTTDEMLQAFSWLGEDLAYEIVVTNTNKLKKMTEPIYPIKDKTVSTGYRRV